MPCVQEWNKVRIVEKSGQSPTCVIFSNNYWSSGLTLLQTSVSAAVGSTYKRKGPKTDLLRCDLSFFWALQENYMHPKDTLLVDSIRFLWGRSTEQAMRKLNQKALIQKRKFVLIFVDLQKAFAIVNRMIYRKCSWNPVYSIKTILNTLMAILRAMVDSFKMERGWGKAQKT